MAPRPRSLSRPRFAAQRRGDRRDARAAVLLRAVAARRLASCHASLPDSLRPAARSRLSIVFPVPLPGSRAPGLAELGPVVDGIPPKLRWSWSTDYTQDDVTFTVTTDETLDGAPIVFVNHSTVDGLRSRLAAEENESVRQARLLDASLQPWPGPRQLGAGATHRQPIRRLGGRAGGPVRCAGRVLRRQESGDPLRPTAQARPRSLRYRRLRRVSQRRCPAMAGGGQLLDPAHDGSPTPDRHHDGRAGRLHCLHRARCRRMDLHSVDLAGPEDLRLREQGCALRGV